MGLDDNKDSLDKVELILNDYIILLVLIVFGVSMIISGLLSYIFSYSIFTIIFSILIGTTIGIMINYFIIRSFKIIKKIRIETLNDEEKKDIYSIMKIDEDQSIVNLR
jgi:ABC-type transport system involved in multi-copper enzyme maturation permease subunit